jgi:hypothetical protein
MACCRFCTSTETEKNGTTHFWDFFLFFENQILKNDEDKVWSFPVNNESLTSGLTQYLLSNEFALLH